MRHLKKSRRELYLSLDQPALKALPSIRYEFAEWKKVRVNINYHIEFDHNFYSVHYTHVHKQLEARATAGVIELFLKGERIASHRRSFLKGKYTTLSEHMPESHRAMQKWPPARLIEWAKSVGPSVGILTEKILSSVKHPEQRYTSAMGLIRLGKKYGNARVEVASRRALELGSHSYRFVADMLKNNMDKIMVSEDQQLILAAVEEANTRGPKYYN